MQYQTFRPADSLPLLLLRHHETPNKTACLNRTDTTTHPRQVGTGYRVTVGHPTYGRLQKQKAMQIKNV